MNKQTKTTNQKSKKAFTHTVGSRTKTASTEGEGKDLVNFFELEEFPRKKIAG